MKIISVVSLLVARGLGSSVVPGGGAEIHKCRIAGAQSPRLVAASFVL
jgi:hypothetical protein